MSLCRPSPTGQPLPPPPTQAPRVGGRRLPDAPAEEADSVPRAAGADQPDAARGGGGGESIEYNHGIRTDAKLLVASKQPDGLLTIDALQATVVEQLGKTIAATIEPENFHLAIEK